MLKPIKWKYQMESYLDHNHEKKENNIVEKLVIRN